MHNNRRDVLSREGASEVAMQACLDFWKVPYRLLITH